MTWPLEFLYAADEKAAVYDILMPLFVQGDLTVMDEKEPVRTQTSTHLKDFMMDSQLYRWEKAWAFRMMWLNQLEQDRVTWEDMEIQLSFCQIYTSLALAYHSYHSCINLSPTFQEKTVQAGFHLQCSSQAYHQGLPGLQSMSLYSYISPCHGVACRSHCLEVVNRMFPQQVLHCKRKHPELIVCRFTQPCLSLYIDLDTSSSGGILPDPPQFITTHK